MKTPHKVDIHVGRQLRQRRTLRGMSQTALGKSVGLTFQQIQKYENGTNRVCASRLWQFANVLRVPVSYFFDGLEENAQPEPVPTRAALELMRNFRAIRTPEVRNNLGTLARSIAAAETGRERGEL